MPTSALNAPSSSAPITATPRITAPWTGSWSVPTNPTLLWTSAPTASLSVRDNVVCGSVCCRTFFLTKTGKIDMIWIIPRKEEKYVKLKKIVKFITKIRFFFVLSIDYNKNICYNAMRMAMCCNDKQII